jgi:hypothetical protein
MLRSLRHSVGMAGALTAAACLVGAGSAAGAGAVQVRGVASTPKLSVVIAKSQFSFSGPHTFRAGRVAVALEAKKADADIDIASFKKGYTFADFKADISAFGASYGKNGLPSKAGLKHLNHAVGNTTLYGGLDADAGTAIRGTVVLPKAGTYYLYNDTNVPADPEKLTVTGPPVVRANPHSSATVKAVNGERFGGATSLPAKGTITFKNASTDSPHFLVLIHVKEGTTRQQVIKFLESGSSGNPPWALRGDISTDVISPGLAQTLTYNLPKGEYVELCFFPDLQTGMPHALMGMVGIVHLK